jgi:hypothetical protein
MTCSAFSSVIMMKHYLFEKWEDIYDVFLDVVSDAKVREVRLLIGEDPGVVVVADDLYLCI